MNLLDQLKQISARIPQQIESIQTEEATKMAFVMPFLQALGYNVFDPREVVPEYTADVGVKKGEKVDYAIVQDGKVLMIIECKTVNSKLKIEQASQLFRYFSVVTSRLAILTDGVRYKFYSDIDTPNKMDEQPFLELDMLNLDELLVAELKAITKNNFNAESMISAASDLRHTREIKSIFSSQLQDPEEEFVKFFVSKFYHERLTPAIKAHFAPIVKRALNQFITERVTGRLTAALAQESSEVIVVAQASASAAAPSTPSSAPAPTEEDGKKGVVTTQEELDAYWAIKAILRESVSASRVAMRDAVSYCAILFDNNNRKPIARLYFNTANWRIGIFDKEKNEEKFDIKAIDDIFDYAGKLKAVVASYVEAAPTQEPEPSKGE